MNKPLVTVLMPNHNGEKYIAASIQSVLDQTFQDWELLIVEDASTDRSVEVIQSFDDPRIRVLPFKKNEHICVALNEGLKVARGKYIARLDSDDCWYPNKLEKQIAYMEAHPECGACFTWVDVMDETNRLLSAEESMFVELFRSKNRSRRQWVYDFFHHGSCLCHPSAVFPLSVVNELGGYAVSLVQVQDFDLWIRIAQKYDLYVFEEPLMRYRHALAGGNVSATTPDNNIRSFYEMHRVISRYFQDMTDEEFIAVFRKDFCNAGAASHEELLCEQALLLMKPVFCGNAGKLTGVNMLSDLMDNEAMRKLLRNQYKVSQFDLYAQTKNSMLLVEDPKTWLHQMMKTGLLESALMMMSGKLLFKTLLRKILWRMPTIHRLLRSLRTFFCKRGH